MKKSSPINFTNTKTILTYDLSPCEITAKDICNEDRRFYNYIFIADKDKFYLPNTTIRTILNKEEAKIAFKTGLDSASFGRETITCLLVVEVDEKNGFIENKN